MSIDNLLYKYIYGMLSVAIMMVLIILFYTMNSYGYFTVGEIVINGNNVVSRDEIIKRSGLIIGESSTLFFDRTIENEIAKNNWIKKADVNKFLPAYIEISIEEEDIFCLFKERDGKLKYINENGRILGDANIQFGLDFPVIISESNIESVDLNSAIELLRFSKADLALNFNNISELYYSSILGITVLTTNGTTIYFGNGNELGERWNSLREIILYSEYSNYKQQYIDLSFDEKIVLKYDPPEVISK